MGLDLFGNGSSETIYDEGKNLFHEADDDAVIWLESTATAALAK